MHAPPRHVGDVQQPVDAAEIDEGAVFGDVLDHAVNDVALGELADDLGALLGAGFLENRAARDHDVAAAPVHLENLEWLLEPHQRPGVAHWPDIDLGSGQEGDGAAEIDGEAALHAAEDRPLDAAVALDGLLEAVPCLLAAGHVAADHRLAARILGGAQEDLHLVARRDVRLLAGSREFLEIDPALHLVADVDQRVSALDGDDRALDDTAFLGRC